MDIEHHEVVSIEIQCKSHQQMQILLSVYK